MGWRLYRLKLKNTVNVIVSAEVEVAKRNEFRKFDVIPKRWVIERRFAWLEKFRRL